MTRKEQKRSTPVDGYNVVELQPGIFIVMSEEGQVGESFPTFSAAYKFIQSMAVRDRS